jgi:flagellar protein FlgJ
MTTPVSNNRAYADFASLDSLKNAVNRNDPAAVRQVAQQFESLFARMMIKSMRDAVGKDPIFGSDQEQMYQGMFDDQLSLELTKGHGLGLGDMLVRQLQRLGAAGAGNPAAPAASAAAASSAGASSTTASHSADQASFIRDVWPEAQRAAQQLGVDPRGLVAQAALETDWGRSVPQAASGSSSNNLFGIKAGSTWAGPGVSTATTEYEGGTRNTTTARFRAYGSRADSFQDYVSLLSSNPRYSAALNTGGNVQAFASALQRGGYATDPDYARKITAIAQALPSADPAAQPLKSASALPIPANVANRVTAL